MTNSAIGVPIVETNLHHLLPQELQEVEGGQGPLQDLLVLEEGGFHNIGDKNLLGTWDNPPNELIMALNMEEVV